MEPINIKLDEQQHTIPPQERLDINTQYGQKSLSVNGGETIELYLDADKDYILNPTKATYYVQNLQYFLSEHVEREYRDLYEVMTSQIDTHEVNGQYEAIKNQLLVENNWEFGLDETPTMHGRIQTANGKGYVNVKKLYREKHLLQLIQLSQSVDGLVQ